jgi:nucleoside 2-deoxyribosyltransferase
MAKAALPDTLDPMARDYRGRELEPGVAREIVENDKADIDQCDALLVNYVKPSVGTSMEILYAWERKKQIVLLCTFEEQLSPWLIYHSTQIVHSLRDAVGLLRDS